MSSFHEKLVHSMELSARKLRGRLIAPYQTSGVRWMLSRELDDLDPIRGGLLADEMGLGKTVQTIATILGNPSTLPTLIVCPKSLVKQWASEIHKFSGIIPLQLSATTINSKRGPSLDLIRNANIIVTTYSALGRVRRESPNVLFRAIFHRIVLDEAHAIKNPKSNVHSTVMELRAHIKWCLTGTPVTRKKSDFRHIIQFIGVSDGQAKELRHKYTLRRTIEDIGRISDRLRLPQCEVKIHTVTFTEAERAMYDDLKNEGRLRLKAYETVVDHENNNMGHIVEVIMRMRQMCVSPQMVFDGRHKEYDDETKWTGGRASKLDALVNHIGDQMHESKTIIFTHWNGEAEMIVEALCEMGGIEVRRLCGNMTSEQRELAIQSFNSGPTSVLVCQIEVGGVGLNLQAATHIYINSPSWNASSELQAIGRAHRTGVKHRVSVTRLVVENTIEQYIHTKQNDKLGYAADILDDDRIRRKLTGGIMSLNEMRKIFE